MARKKRPTISGEDPTYRSDFAATNFQKLPTVEPQPTSAPKDATAKAPEPDLPAAETPEQPADETQTKVVETRTAEPKAAMAVKPKRARAPKTSKPAAEPPVPAPAPITRRGRGGRPAPSAPKRELQLVVAAKPEQHDKLLDLEKRGVAPKDAVALAGRRAVKRFEPKPEFVPLLDVERMPLRQHGYRTTKRVDAALLDVLRAEQDPLGIKSDTAMLIGQFEPLFWECIDEVIAELEERF